MANRLKSSAARYRTIKGETYVCWLVSASDDRVAAYRAAHIRCRRLEYDLLVHENDIEAAKAIDRAAE